jgi:methionine synthase II (cobalamin-independent)
MISNLKYDIEFRREKALELSAQVEQHMAAGGRFSRSEPAQINPAPAERSAKIDPDTVLKRRRQPITAAERKVMRKLAEAL